MKLKTVIGSLIVIAILALGFILLSRTDVQSKFKVGDCFSDKSLGVKFKVMSVSGERYDLVVVSSGHYQNSPEYAKGTELAYSRAAVDAAVSYHPAFCEGAVSDSKPNE